LNWLLVDDKVCKKRTRYDGVREFRGIPGIGKTRQDKTRFYLKVQNIREEDGKKKKK
jgi:hypothetical protein